RCPTYTPSEAIDFFAHLDQNASAQVNPLVISKYGASEDYPESSSALAQDIAEIKELLKQKGGDVDC
ncbi:hypothetical protein CMV_026871, partial [Castanea mollissima]